MFFNATLIRGLYRNGPVVSKSFQRKYNALIINKKKE